MADAAIAVVTGADGYVALEIIKQLLEKVNRWLSAVLAAPAWLQCSYTPEVQLVCSVLSELLPTEDDSGVSPR